MRQPDNARETETVVRDSYEQVPYAAASHHQSHPDHLAVLALLHGLAPTPPRRCKVLEIGCAGGGNLIPMALDAPESTFVGIDLSPRQIESGRALARELGLKNVELQTMSVVDFDASRGPFDYVIAHGVFSWVDSEVQEKVLDVCDENLAPNGIAYISYNTYPGWHLRNGVRDMVTYHTRGVDDPYERAAQAMELIRFLADKVAQGDDTHALFLRSTREHFEEYADRPDYLLHEYFEHTNAPIYFHEFVARASRHGLQYVSDAEQQLSELDNLSPEVATQLRSYTANRVELEQYLDFVVNRSFRRTLLCRDGVALDRAMRPERMRRMYAATAAKPTSDSPDFRQGISETFETEKKKPFTSSHPAAKAVIAALAEVWPRAISFDELTAGVRARGAEADEHVLADLLYALFWSGIAELHSEPPSCTEKVTARPRASVLARRQAADGLLVTNQRGRVLKLDDPIARFLLTQLDGSHDRAALLRLLDREVGSGRLDISVDGKPISDPQRIPMVLQAVLDHHLIRMARLALLVG